MFDTVNDLPLHPIVVHAVVVLLPLAALGTIAIALKPAWRRTYGPLVVATSAIATVMTFVAIQAGESFEERLGIEVQRHEDLGRQLIWFALALLVLVVALVVLDRREVSAVGIKVLAGLCVLAALAATAQVVATADAGGRRVWCGLGNPTYDCDPE